MTIGIAPCIVRDLALRASELPTEQLIKAQTLGASTLATRDARGSCRRCGRG